MTLEQQLAEILEAFTRQTTAHLEERIRSLSADVTQAAVADRTAAMRELRLAADAEIARRSQEAVAAVQAEAARRTEDAVTAARAEHAQRLEESIAAVRSDHEKRIEEAASAARAQAVREHDAALHEVRSDSAARLEEALAASRLEAQRELAAALDAARVEADEKLNVALAAAHTEADQRLESALADARLQAETSGQQAAERAMVEFRAADRHAELAGLERIVDAVRRFDSARTLTEVLDVLGDVTSREAPRVALFLVRAGRLAGWRASGFARDFDPRSVEVVNDTRSLLWGAVASGSALGTTSASLGDRLATPFGALPDDSAGLAVPVRVGGETVAVIYADDVSDGPRQVPSAWPEVIEVLARHAGRCLEVLTISRSVPSAPASPQARPRAVQPDRAGQPSTAEDEDAARRYARLLVSEIKLYHEAAVTEGRDSHNLAHRLQAEIGRARRLYEERVHADIRARTNFFDQELVRTLANGDPALLGAAGT